MGKKRTNVSIDVESDGPIISVHSMVSFGAVIVDGKFETTFYGQTKPISNIWLPEALAVSGHTRDEHKAFPDPWTTMDEFRDWLKENCEGRPVFWSDNNGYDWKFIDYYLLMYGNKNPFGWSSQNINSFYKGLTKSMYGSFKHLRDTKHTHHPVDDAKGNAEALWKMFQMLK